MNLRRNDGRTSSYFITKSKECIFGIWRTPPTIGRARNTRRHVETRRRKTGGGAAVGVRGGCRRCTTHRNDPRQRMGTGVATRPAAMRMAASRNVAGGNEMQRQKEQKPEDGKSTCHVVKSVLLECVVEGEELRARG